MTIDIALYQPDIAQNTGTTIRTAACFASNVHIIEPCGFVFNDRKFRRSGMDYIENVEIIRHLSWQSFSQWVQDNHKRLILMTTKSSDSYTDFHFTSNDILVAGRETAGVPDEVHQACTNRVTILMHNNLRSLNVAVATAIILSEAIRQISIP